MSAKKIISAALIGALLSTTILAGCDSTSTPQNSSQSGTQQSTGSSSITIPEDGGYKTVSYELSNDKYRTFYEIFPYSFCDSDGDGIGDLNGITSKLDYLNDGDPSTTDDLGIEGIWLMPIMSSPSYHKYNISDYMTVDKAYGTNEDLKNLVDEAHKRNINVIIDFVINHTSRSHEWYQKAIAELKEGKTDGYAQYYHFEENNNVTGWNKAGVGDWYYECQFDSDMPDLNLKNENLRNELKEIVKYWITEMGVDGFRLDAVKYFESAVVNDETVEDLQWLYDYAKTLKEDVYMVGECWDTSSAIAKCYESGADSFFNFDMQGSTGKVASSINQKDAIGFVTYLEEWQTTIKERNANAIDTPFLSNHDTARSAGFFTTLTKQKMAAAMYMLSPGNSFIYYGEEIGMTGSASDPDKRTGMYWSSTDTTGYVSSIPGATNKNVPEKSVEEQLEDEDSLLTFYKKVIALKNQNPEIARGTLTAVDLGNDETAGYISTYNDSQVMVIFNLSDEGSTVTVPSDKFTINEVRGYAIADSGDEEEAQTTDIDALLNPNKNTDESSEEVSQEEETEITEFSVNGSEVTLPAYSVIVLK